ncbi:MAG: hypothetical protein IJM45_02160 [Clostridia bacterium]|nr:hypothetical protein [Clostridia bacterium]
MSEYYNDTLDGLNSFLLERKDIEAYRKLEGSSSKGFVYFYKGKNGENILADVRVDEHLEYVIFRAYNGSLMTDMAFLPTLAEFCARHPLPVGDFEVNCEHRNVYYHCEAAFIDFAVTEKTLLAFEECAAAGFAAYGKAFDCIANGKLYSEAELGDPSPALKRNKRRLAPTVNKIREYMIKDSGYNSRCEAFGNDRGDLFFGEVLTGERRYHLRISYASDDRSFLVMRLYPAVGTVVAEPYIHMCATFANKRSDKVKVGCLRVNSVDGEGCCCVIHIPLIEGDVTGKTVEDAEKILISFFVDMEDDLEYIAHGCLPPETDGKDGKIRGKGGKRGTGGRSPGMSSFIDELLADLRGHAGDDDDDDEDDDDDDDDDVDFPDDLFPDGDDDGAEDDDGGIDDLLDSIFKDGDGAADA